MTAAGEADSRAPVSGASAADGGPADETGPDRTATAPAFEAGAAYDGLLADVRRRMRAAIRPPGDGRDGLYRWLAYHLGWAEVDHGAAPPRVGKGIRPLVSLIACEAAGADPAHALGVAAAIEMTHEFSLVHDDIEDGDTVRRGRPTLWSVAGVPQAINAGDALFSLARSELTCAPPALPDAITVDLMRRYDRACLSLAEGQFLDIAFEAAEHIALDDYLRMVAGKTGALLGAAAGMGARAASAPAMVADALTRYGAAVGTAFQMQDDVLGIWGDAALTGKSTANDLVRRKKSLPVVLALADPALGPELASAFRSDGSLDEAEAARWAGRIEAAGHRGRCEALAREHLETALAMLAGCDLARGPREVLESLAWYAVRRDR